ncbi:MAG: TPM domain-containing protein [Rhodospirillales bacterium]|nr:TPM domain-containing protein [Rhodospirillales bacterium]
MHFFYLFAVFLWVLNGTSAQAFFGGCKNSLVCDEAELFEKGQQDWIGTYHATLLKEDDIDYRVLTTSKTVDINVLAHEKFKEMKVGQRSKSGRGLLLVIAIGNFAGGGEVRLEVSAGLEGVYTDAFISYIQHRQMVPFFRAGRVADGILATTEMIVTRAIEAKEGQEFSPPMESFSTGAGAANPAQIGAGMQRLPKDFPAPALGSLEAASPQQILDIYLGTLEDRNANPDLPIFTKATREWKKTWVVTPAQMDNEAKSLHRCGQGVTKIKGKYAVIRFGPPESKRECNPFFFEEEDGVWRLNFLMLMKAVRFNHRNEWHFDLSTKHPYGFAFTDWHFDQYGFPH